MLEHKRMYAIAYDYLEAKERPRKALLLPISDPDEIRYVATYNNIRIDIPGTRHPRFPKIVKRLHIGNTVFFRLALSGSHSWTDSELIGSGFIPLSEIIASKRN